jgi:hypothetical protein
MIMEKGDRIEALETASSSERGPNRMGCIVENKGL